MSDAELYSRARLGVTLTFLTQGFIVSSIIARFPDFKERLNLTNSVLGLCLLSTSIGVLCALGPAARLAATYGSSKILTKANYLVVAVAPLVGLAINAPTFSILLFFFGFALALQDVCMNTHGVALEQRTGMRFLGKFHAFWSIGGLSGAFAGGIFSQLRISEFIHFLIICALVVVIVIFNNKSYLNPDVDKQEIPKTGTAKKKKPQLIFIMGLLGLAGSIGEGSAGDWGGVLTRETFGASQFASTLPFIAYSLTMVIGRLFGDKLASKFGAYLILKVAGIIGGLGLAIGLFVGGTGGVIAGWFLFGIGLSTVIPLIFSAAGSMANERFHGQISPSEAIAMISGISYFGFIVGPPLMGFLADVVTLRWAMLVPAMLAITISLSSNLFTSDQQRGK